MLFSNKKYKNQVNSAQKAIIRGMQNFYLVCILLLNNGAKSYAKYK